MKKQEWALAAATIVYSYIFYRQNAGINFFIFTVLVIVLLGWANPAVRSSRKWLFYAGLAFLSGTFVFIHNSWLSVLANVLSLFVLGGISARPSSSALGGMISSALSSAGSVAFISLGLYARTPSHQNGNKVYFRRILAYAVPLAFALLFFVIYRQANPLFAEYTKAINLEFVTPAWILFLISGLLLTYGVLRTRAFEPLEVFDRKVLTENNTTQSGWDEQKAATILFTLLNAMLLFMNILDLRYLYFGAGLPGGITHKQFVHNGVGNLIFSIVLGIAVISYFFRGALNVSAGVWLRRLVFLWLAQNVFMVVSTMLRNHIYITEALLTYKRIGVFFWTGLAGAGLIITGLKVYHKLHFWYLVRANGGLWVVVLVVAAGVDWDSLITRYNLQNVSSVKELDKRYLIALSESNLKDLYLLRADTGFENNIWYHYENNCGYHNREALDQKLVRFLGNMEDSDWRSWGIRRSRVLSDISWLDGKELITTLDLSRQPESELATFAPVRHARSLILPEGFVFTGEKVALINSMKNLQRIEAVSLSPADLLQAAGLRDIQTLFVRRLDATGLAFLQSKLTRTQVIVGTIYSAGNSTARR